MGTSVILPLSLLFGFVTLIIVFVIIRCILWKYVKEKLKKNNDNLQQSIISYSPPITKYVTSMQLPNQRELNEFSSSVFADSNTNKKQHKSKDNKKHPKVAELNKPILKRQRSRSLPSILDIENPNIQGSQSPNKLKQTPKMSSAGLVTQEFTFENINGRQGMQKKTKSLERNPFRRQSAAVDDYSSFSNSRQKRKISTNLEQPVLIENAPLYQVPQSSTTRTHRFRKSSKPKRRPSSILSVLDTIQGQVELMILFNEQERRIQITVFRLSNLSINPDHFIGTLEIYSKNDTRKKATSIYLVRDDEDNLQINDISQLGYLVHLTMLPGRVYSQATRTILAKDDLLFEETFEFPCDEISEIMNQTLCVHVICKFGKNSEPIVIGELKVALDELQLGLPISSISSITQPTEEVELEDIISSKTDLGELLVQLNFNPIAHKLDVKVVGAKWLPKLGVTGAPTTSVKVFLYNQGVRLDKKMTCIQKRSRNPVFNETFSFDVSKDKLSTCDILFAVRHHGPMYRTRIGYVLIGASAGHHGYKHWEDCLEFETNEKSHRIQQNKPVGLICSFEDNVSIK